MVLTDDQTLELMEVLDSWKQTAEWRLEAGAAVGDVLGLVRDPVTGEDGRVLETATSKQIKKGVWAHRVERTARKTT